MPLDPTSARELLSHSGWRKLVETFHEDIELSKERLLVHAIASLDPNVKAEAMYINAIQKVIESVTEAANRGGDTD